MGPTERDARAATEVLRQAALQHGIQQFQQQYQAGQQQAMAQQLTTNYTMRVTYVDAPAAFTNDLFWGPPTTRRHGERTITHTPKKVKELMEIPERIEIGHLQLAQNILGDGSIGYASEYTYRRRAFVQLAVEKQWRTFTPERFLKEAKLKLLAESDKGNKLYEQKRRFLDVHRLRAQGRIRAQARLYLVYTCPSTGKLYISGVPGDLDYKHDKLDADRAMAWKFHLTLEEYHNLDAEA